MAQIKDIIEIENRRTDDRERSIVYLFKEGSFLRAYEWSAWLICMFINEFKVTHKRIKSLDQSVAFVGFPQTSLSKYTPEGCEVLQVQNDLFQIQLSGIAESKMKELDSATAFEDWKRSFPLIEH